MPFKLTTYQDEAASELLQDAVRLLKQAGGKKLVFKAPTGSGKTITMAEFLTRFEDDTDHPPCAFIWAAPRQLHEQSREKLERYFENSRAMECSSFEELRDRQIGENEILFFNWESIRQDGNIYIRDNEQENNLSNIIERTREAGRAVVLIIDESHFHAQAETSQNLIAAIAPNLTIEISATPVMQNPDRIVPIELEAVKAEEMIKKGVVLNEDFKNIVQRGGTEKIESALAGSTDETVLREALKKREQLTKAYRAAGIGVNPLLLIQLPDRRGQADDERQALVVRALKDKHGITVENGKLAIYLSENKENLENITKNESEVDVLIFKQAIALGWDCPRAQILVLFREWHSPVFSIQTLGRIVRVVEPTHGYYENDLLNYAYVYTNIDDIEIKEDIGRGYVVIHVADRIAGYVALKLPSVHRKRHREQTRLSPLFTQFFLEEAEKEGLAEKLQLKGQRVQPSLISDWRTENIDAIAGGHIRANVELENASDMDVQRLFDYFVRRNLSPFYPEDRSVGRLKESVYQFFDKRLSMPLATNFRDIINITLSDDNRAHFETVIAAAKRVYTAAIERRDRELANGLWDVPERVLFGEGYTEVEKNKSVIKPFFSDERWRSENAFIDFLEQSRNGVKWWFKNGDRDATFFAVPYKNGKDWSPFYVDFVVLMKDGSVGLFDPHGLHLADFGAKSDGLRAYIREQNDKKKRVFGGGIVANTDARNFTGQWMLYQGSGNPQPDDWSDWSPLQL
jgi:type III restriction enzyme